MADKEYIFIEGFATGRQYYTLMKCLYLSSILHAGQYRKSGEEYICHPTSVTATLIRNNILDETTLCIAQLHDVYEDCGVSETDLLNKYGIPERVVKGVMRLSKTHDTNLKAYFDEISKYKEETLVKIADRAHNVSTMYNAFRVEKQYEYVDETKEYILPLCKTARRLYPEYSFFIMEKKSQIETLLKLTIYFLDAMGSKEPTKPTEQV
jgi:(p)ppGpp synthase/HD superfamily hydrolase